MRNPILQQTVSSMNSSDVRTLLNLAVKKKYKLMDEIELNKDTISILMTELSKRNSTDNPCAEILLRSTRPDND